MDAQKAMLIVQSYGAVLEENSPTPGYVADVATLPFPKELIKAAIRIALLCAKEQELHAALTTAYLSIAHWQEGVGEKQIGFDPDRYAHLMASELTSPETLRRIELELNAQTHWTPIVESERSALQQELTAFLEAVMAVRQKSTGPNSRFDPA